MSWSYSGNPGTSPLDEVRFLSGTTTETAESPSDEEIAYLLLTGKSPRRVAIQVAEATARRFAAKPDRQVGSLSLSFKNQAEGFFAIADRLRDEDGADAGALIGPVWGGGGKTYLGTSDTDATGDAFIPFYGD